MIHRVRCSLVLVSDVQYDMCAVPYQASHEDGNGQQMWSRPEFVRRVYARPVNSAAVTGHVPTNRVRYRAHATDLTSSLLQALLKCCRDCCMRAEIRGRTRRLPPQETGSSARLSLIRVVTRVMASKSWTLNVDLVIRQDKAGRMNSMLREEGCE